MSGIYLIVWDETGKEKSPVLKATKGGYPHITLAYTGDHMDTQDLSFTASKVILDVAQLEITLTKAYVNSFQPKDAPFRHDVLIEIAEEALIEQIRQVRLKASFPKSDLFSMRKPHVTHGIFDNVDDAQATVKLLNEHHLPLKVKITGVTID